MQWNALGLGFWLWGEWGRLLKEWAYICMRRSSFPIWMGNAFCFEWADDGRWEAEVTFPFIAFLHTGLGCQQRTTKTTTTVKAVVGLRCGAVAIVASYSFCSAVISHIHHNWITWPGGGKCWMLRIINFMHVCSGDSRKVCGKIWYQRTMFSISNFNVAISSKWLNLKWQPVTRTYQAKLVPARSYKQTYSACNLPSTVDIMEAYNWLDAIPTNCTRWTRRRRHFTTPYN